MDDKKMKELMIDYIDGRLTGELKTFVEKYISKTDESRKEFESLRQTASLLEQDKELEPDSNLRLEFMNHLEEEIQQLEEGLETSETKVIGLRLANLWQIAAAVALLVAGGLGGIWYMQENENDTQMMALKKEMESTKELVMMALEHTNSPSERMMGVNASYNMAEADDDIVKALVQAMNTDENTNVRLAAINALAHFKEDKQVRRALINALPNQADPLIQITLINLMVEMKEKGSVNELKDIIQDSTTMEAVKDEAHMAVFKLS